MELFPERDGNVEGHSTLARINLYLSEWSSSLKGMETISRIPRTSGIHSFVRMELFPERDGNGHLRDPLHPKIISVRMELFPERDGNNDA